MRGLRKASGAATAVATAITPAVTTASPVNRLLAAPVNRVTSSARPLMFSEDAAPWSSGNTWRDRPKTVG
ncbi:hypothetical protein SGLAM104S_09134 [Streptomyces glaucescens]